MSPEQSQYIWRKTIPHIEVGMGSGVFTSHRSARDFLACLRPYNIRLSSIGKQGMDRKSDRALRDRDSSGKKESLSESVDHTLGDRDRGTPDYLESIQVLKE
ncbi:hypothetical protein CsSME_00004792 [Camellia sinensis var. sinensis]